MHNVSANIANAPAVSVLSARRAWSLLLLALAIWAGGYARVALGPLQESMRSALALSDNQIALLQGPAVGLSVMLGAIPMGVLIDRHSRARLLCLFVAFALGGSVLTALAHNLVVLFAARCVVGLASIAALIAGFSLIADLYPPTQRGRATMVLAGAFELSSPVAFALGGALLVAYGAAGDAWRWTMLSMTVPPLMLIAVLTLGLREPPRSGIAIKSPPLVTAFAELWRLRPMIAPLLAARVMVGVADGATLIWAAPLLTRKFGLAPDRVGAIMATVLLVASLLAPLAGGCLADLCQRAGGPRRTMLALSGLATLTLPASTFAIVPGLSSASALLCAFITLGFMTNIAGATLSTIVIPNEIRGTYLSISMLVGALFGVALAPLLVSSLSAAMEGPASITTALAIVCISTSAFGAATFAYGSRSFPSKIDRVTQGKT